MSKINFFALGGLDEKGKNSYVLDIDGKLFIINAGTKVPINSHNGIDTLICNYDYLEKRQKDIVGLFLTDVQNKSFSAIPWLLMKIKGLKIYTSAFNKIVTIDRISKYKIEHNDYEIKAINKETHFGNVSVTPIDIAGSLPGQVAFNFHTNDGNILFLTNFVDGNLGPYGQTDIARIKQSFKNKPLKILIMDSGKSNYPGRSIDKLWVSKKIEYKFKEASAAKKRVIVGLYDEDMITAHEILVLAKRYNMPVITYGRTYSQLISLVKKVDNKLQWPEFIDYRAANDIESAVILVTGAIERLYLRFVRIATDHDIYLKIRKDDAVIVIVPPINGLEVNYAHTLDEIARNTSNLIELDSDQYYSCNPAKEDIKNFIKALSPKYFIPIQGLYRYLVVATQDARSVGMNVGNCIVLQNGRVAEFQDWNLTGQKHTIRNVGDVIIDGFGVGDISHEVIKERENLARDGIIALSCLIDYKKRTPINTPQITSYGVITKDNKDVVYNIIQELFEKEFANKRSPKEIDLRDIQDKLRRGIRKKIYKAIEKEPMVIITLYEI
ncbi:ribonuclease J [Metamycoplasma arthritidis]|uniref:Predicted hydrolase, metallo-beta-lactamase superfamily n=1 Tax=Metamycoplasma arthritidis (strain 158L3-1) TaxID=243272 RepID=B3PN39_META1|nr:ribonuclease J [Metamycoplasma arthritidis]ACF07441.1 predicted hydrolase, metallo-beta-lactamase superfamily [Metamycoplasma arthritidis 158L3-1]